MNCDLLHPILCLSWGISSCWSHSSLFNWCFFQPTLQFEGLWALLGTSPHHVGFLQSDVWSECKRGIYSSTSGAHMSYKRHTHMGLQENPGQSQWEKMNYIAQSTSGLQDFCSTLGSSHSTMRASSFPIPHTCCLCASCFYMLHQDTKFCSGIPAMAWHQSRESNCTLPWYIVGLGKHAQSQTSENELKIPSILGLQELPTAQHSGCCHYKTTNVLYLWRFVLCLSWLGHMISQWKSIYGVGMEVRSTVAHCHAAPCGCYIVQSIQRYMSSAQHSGSLTLQLKFCRVTNMVVFGSCVAQVCLGHIISPGTSSYGMALKLGVQSHLDIEYLARCPWGSIGRCERNHSFTLMS